MRRIEWNKKILKQIKKIHQNYRELIRISVNQPADFPDCEHLVGRNKVTWMNFRS